MRLGMSKLQWDVRMAAELLCWKQAGPLLAPSSQLWSDSSSVLEPKQMQAEEKVEWEERSSVQLEDIFAMLTSQGCLIIRLIC